MNHPGQATGTGSVPPVGHHPTRPAAPGSAGQVLLGLGLLLPALIALIWSYVVPSLSTVVTSFRHDNLLGRSRPAGGDNYQAIFENGFAGQLGFALLLGLLPLAFALLVAPLLAFVADRAGRVPRLVTRAVLAFPIAAYAPAALFVGWRLKLVGSRSMLDGSAPARPPGQSARTAAVAVAVD